MEIETATTSWGSRTEEATCDTPVLLAASEHFRVTGLPALLIILAILAVIVVGLVTIVRAVVRR